MATAEALLPRAHARVRKLDLRVAVGLLLMMVAVVGGASLIKSAQARIPVLVAAGTVEPGQVIEASDIRVVEASLAGGIAHLPASMQDSIVGRVATEPLWEGKLLSPNSASDAPPLAPGTVAMSLQLKPDSRALRESRRPTRKSGLRERSPLDRSRCCRIPGRAGQDHLHLALPGPRAARLPGRQARPVPSIGGGAVA